MLIRCCHKCGKQIDDQKRARKSPYCSPECRRSARIEMCQLRSTEVCRLCKRKMPHRKPEVAIRGCAPGAQVGA